MAFQHLGQMYAFCAIFLKFYLIESDSILETNGEKKIDKKCRHNVCLKMICREQKQRSFKARAQNWYTFTE